MENAKNEIHGIIFDEEELEIDDFDEESNANDANGTEVALPQRQKRTRKRPRETKGKKITAESPAKKISSQSASSSSTTMVGTSPSEKRNNSQKTSTVPPPHEKRNDLGTSNPKDLSSERRIIKIVKNSVSTTTTSIEATPPPRIIKINKKSPQSKARKAAPPLSTAKKVTPSAITDVLSQERLEQRKLKFQLKTPDTAGQTPSNSSTNSTKLSKPQEKKLEVLSFEERTKLRADRFKQAVN